MSEGDLNALRRHPSQRVHYGKRSLASLISVLATLRTVSVHGKEFQITVTIAAEDD